MERTFELRDRQFVEHLELPDGYPLMRVVFGNGEVHMGNRHIDGYGRPAVVFKGEVFYGRLIGVEPFGAEAEQIQPHAIVTVNGEPLWSDVLVPYSV